MTGMDDGGSPKRNPAKCEAVCRKGARQNKKSEQKSDPIESDFALAARRKRLLFRAQRRGFKEVDLIFGTFAAAEAMGLAEAEIVQFEALLDAPDQDVYAWLTGFQPVPPEHDTALFERLKALCRRKDPTWNV